MHILLIINVHNMDRRGYVRILESYLLNYKTETEIMNSRSAYIRKNTARMEFSVLKFYTTCLRFVLITAICLTVTNSSERNYNCLIAYRENLYIGYP